MMVRVSRHMVGIALVALALMTSACALESGDPQRPPPAPGSAQSPGSTNEPTSSPTTAGDQNAARSGNKVKANAAAIPGMYVTNEYE